MVVSEKGELLGKGEGRRRREWMATPPRANSSRIKKTGGGRGGRAASTRGGRSQIFRGISLRFRCDRICPHDLHRFRPCHQIRNGETHLELFRRSLPIAITIVYAANAAPNEIGIWFLLSAHPFLALPARLREAAATVNLGSTTRAEIFQLGREGKGRGAAAA